MPHQSVRTRNLSEGILCLLAVFSLLLILRNTAVATDYMLKGLSLCARTVIPALFPFMILSDLLLSFSWLDRPLSILCTPLKKLLSLPAAGCRALVLGLLCGFPVGARCALTSLEKGELTKSQCVRVLALSSPPSSAFVIGVVGSALWGSQSFGVALYLSVILAALLAGILTVRRKEAMEAAVITALPTRHAGGNRLTRAVRRSTESMLLICAYVVFFTALTGTVGCMLSSLGASDVTSAILTAFFEMSSGVSALSSLSARYPAALLTAATLAWSGLSVHCQMMALCAPYALPLRSYFLSKLLQAVLCVLLLASLLFLGFKASLPCACYP